MKPSVKSLFIGLSLLVAGAVFWSVPSVSQERPGTDADARADGPTRSEGDNRPQETRVTGIQLVQFEDGHTRWTLKAPSARTDGEERVLVHQPDLTIYKKDGQISSVTSEEGLISGHSGQGMNGRAMLFTGAVVANNGTQHLSTETLNFDPVEQTLYTDQPFVLVDEEMHMEGIGLTLYQKTQKLTVSHRVRVHYSTAQEGVYREKADLPPHHS